MGANVTTTLSGRKETIINGRTYNVLEENGKQYVVIDGKRVDIKSPLFDFNSNLTEWPEHFVEYYDKLLAKDEEKKEALENESTWLHAQLKNAKKAYDGILIKYNVDSYKDIDDNEQQSTAKKFFKSISDFKFALIGNSNRYYSACMSAFNNALDKGNWDNQLSLAKHVSKNA